MATETDLIGVSASPTTPRGNEADLIGVSASRTAAPQGEVIDDPFQLFRASVDTGVANTKAQISNFRAAVNSLMGQEEKMQNNLAAANRVTESSANYLANMDTFEEFLDEPTFGGFINQAIQATGQFVPSAVASIGLAMTGAGVGVGATAALGRTVGTKALTKTASKSLLPTSIAKEAGDRAAVQKVVNKFVALEANKAKKRPTKLDPLTPDEEKMINNLYAFIRSKRRGTAAKAGALLGAGSQEQVMGTGIAFSDYAEQGMTTADDAIASFAQGGVFAAIGLGSEVAVARSVAKVLKTKAPKGINTAKDAPVEGIASRLGKVVGTTSVAEGLAEAGQEELSVQQKFRIDEDYTKAMANLDRANALFAGFFGGVGIGTAIGTPSAVIGKSYDQMKQGYLLDAQAQFEKDMAGQTVAETEADLRDQFEAMGIDSINKDFVWVLDSNKKTMENIESEMRSKYPNMEIVEVNDVGTLYTTNPQRAESFSNYMSSNTLSKALLDQWLADNNGYTRRSASADSLAVRVLSPGGNVVWEQTTSAEGEADALAAGERVINNTPGYTTDTKTLDSVKEARMDAMQDDGLDEQQQELANIYDVQEPTAVEEGRGSFLDPITPRQKGTQVWAIPSTDITYDQALVEEARALVPTEFEREFDQDISKKRYSESLLKAFIKENVNDTTGAFYKINENTDRGGFNLIKYNMGYTPGVSTPSTADITKVVNRAKRNARGSRFTIETPAMDKPVGIDMPTLVNQGRVLARRFGESLSQDEFGSAIDGLAFILGSMEGNFALYYDDKLVDDAAFNDPGAFVYTKNKGKERFTLQDLQRGRASQVKSGDLEAGFDPREDINQEVVPGETEGATEPTPDERAENEFKRRLFKNPYAKGSTKATGPKPGIYFSSAIEQAFGVSFLNDFKSIASRTLFLKRPYRVFSAEENILEQVQEDIDANKLDYDIREARDTIELNRRRVQEGLDQPGGTGIFGGNIPMKYTGLPYDIIMVPTSKLTPAGITELNAAEQGKIIFAVAHEIGHSFFTQEVEASLKNGKLRDSLLKAFEKELETNPTSQYQGERGFEEWMSDQVGTYLVDQTLKAQNQTDSFFKRIADKIRAFFNDVNNIAKNRYKQDQAFLDYVVELKKLNMLPDRTTNYQANAEIEQTVEKIGKEIPLGDPKAPQKIQQTVNKLKESGEALGVGQFIKSVLFPKDNLLRGFGPAGIKLAQMFRGQSQTTEEVGLLTAAVTQARAKMNEIQDILGVFKAGDMTQDKLNILLEAESSTPTEELTDPRAVRIREWLSEHYDKLNLQEIGIGKLSNFFPRSIAVNEIAGDAGKKQALVELLMEFNDGLTEQQANQAVEATLADISSEIEIESDGAKYNIGLLKARAELYKNVPTERLRQAEVLEEPHRALQKYIDNTVKRVELNKRGGPQRIAELLSEIKDPKQRELAEQSVMAMLGKVTPISSGMFRGANQIGLAFNVTTLLTFATFASFPDLAGPILRSKDFGALRTASKTIFNVIKNKEEAAQLAKDIGVIGIDAMMETFVGAGELDYTSENTKKFTNKFFRAIGLEQFTRFTRVFAAGMGKAFLIDNGKKAAAGDKTAIRYLKELGVTAEEVNNWAGGNINEAGNEKIKLALARFVDESIVRPNAAERPIWASNPHFALVWQLKSFFYAYGKTIVGGSINEMQARYTEAGVKGAAVPLFLGAATLLPLTMLGFDLRERFKVGLAWVLPGVSPDDKNYRRSQDMDWGEYTTEIIDRSGVLGPFTLALPLFMEDRRYGDPMWVGPLGPTVEKGYDLFMGDLRLKDLTPLYNNL